MMIDEIMSTHERLDDQLKIALSHMERSDVIFEIRQEIKKNQLRCPHQDNVYNLQPIHGCCPYCGKELEV